MKKCWKSKPADRPTFSELVTSIEGLADNLTGYITPMSELILNRGIERLQPHLQKPALIVIL